MKGSWLLGVLCALLHGAVYAADISGAATAAAPGHVLAAAPAGAPQAAAHMAAAGPVGASSGPAVRSVGPAASPEGLSKGRVRQVAGPAGPAVGPAGPEPAARFTRTLLGVSGCSNNALPQLPNNAQWSTTNNCNNESLESDPGTQCTAVCVSGYTSSGSWAFRCVFQTVVYNWLPDGTGSNVLTCTAGCSETPASAGFTLPANAVWACGESVTAAGSTCAAQCPSGYSLAGGPWVSSCTSAPAWQAPVGTPITCTEIVLNGPCANTPGPSTAGMPSNAAWSCVGLSTASGSSCQASCQSGFANVATTSYTAACQHGVWQAPSGALSCVPASAPCVGPPPSTWLPAGGKWDCPSGVSQGGACTASCQQGYTQTGGLNAFCFNGAYIQPTSPMACVLPATAPCIGPPPSTWLPAGGKWDCPSGVVHNGACTASCQQGYTQTGALNAFCFNVTVSCTAPPPSTWLPAGGKWDCPSGVMHSGACTASCQQAYTQTGGLNATCSNGTYGQPTTPMACVPPGCKEMPGSGLDPDATWNCTLPASNGHNCTAACAGTTAPQNAPTVICDFGSWVYSSGSCADETTKNFFFTTTGPDDLINRLKNTIENNRAQQLANNALQLPSTSFLVPMINVSSIKVSDVWISQSNSSSRRRHLLAAQDKNELVIGVRVSFGEDIIAQTVGTAVDAVFNSPSAANYILTQGLDIWRGNYVEESLLQQVSLGLSDSIGRPIGSPAGADGCRVELLPTTPVNNSIGILNTQQKGPVYDVFMCSGWDTLYATYEYIASSAIAEDTKLTVAILNSATAKCSVSPEVVSTRASSVMVACKNSNGSPFTEAASYTVLVTANYTCNGQPSALFDTTNVAVLKAANLTLRPGKQPDPGCGGKPAVAIFRYQLRGLQLNQDFKLTAEVAPNCTARLISRPSKSNGVAVVTCSGAFSPGVPTEVSLNLTASVQGCLDIRSTSKVSVPVVCCVTGSSYAKGAANRPTCFQHFKPGTTAAQCNKPVSASGYLNRGPGSAKLFLAQSPSSCSDTVAVGNVTMSCPAGDAARKLRFSIQTFASRLTDRRYLVLCTPPAAPAQCPGPRWVSVRAKPGLPGLPEGLISTTTNGVTTVEFNVATRCACSTAYYGVVESANYRNLPVETCAR